MRNFFVFLVLVTGLTMSTFSQEEVTNTTQNKHNQFDQYFGFSLGGGGMRLNDGSIYSTDIGVSYDFYLFSWLSINSGVYIHKEFYNNQLADSRQKFPNGMPLCFTIPLGVHFNIPKVEWLYLGINFSFNIPILDMNSPSERETYSTDDVFYSLPIDLGFDFIKPNKGGSRLFFRATPTFYKNGVSVPVGIVWQVYNWEVFKPKVEVNVPEVEVNVPPPPRVIIIH